MKYFALFLAMQMTLLGLPLSGYAMPDTYSTEYVESMSYTPEEMTAPDPALEMLQHQTMVEQAIEDFHTSEITEAADVSASDSVVEPMVWTPVLDSTETSPEDYEGENGEAEEEDDGVSSPPDLVSALPTGYTVIETMRTHLGGGIWSVSVEAKLYDYTAATTPGGLDVLKRGMLYLEEEQKWSDGSMEYAKVVGGYRSYELKKTKENYELLDTEDYSIGEGGEVLMGAKHKLRSKVSIPNGVEEVSEAWDWKVKDGALTGRKEGYRSWRLSTKTVTGDETRHYDEREYLRYVFEQDDPETRDYSLSDIREKAGMIVERLEVGETTYDSKAYKTLKEHETSNHMLRDATTGHFQNITSKRTSSETINVGDLLSERTTVEQFEGETQFYTNGQVKRDEFEFKFKAGLLGLLVTLKQASRTTKYRENGSAISIRVRSPKQTTMVGQNKLDVTWDAAGVMTSGSGQIEAKYYSFNDLKQGAYSEASSYFALGEVYYRGDRATDYWAYPAYTPLYEGP